MFSVVNMYIWFEITTWDWVIYPGFYPRKKDLFSLSHQALNAQWFWSKDERPYKIFPFNISKTIGIISQVLFRQPYCCDFLGEPSLPCVENIISLKMFYFADCYSLSSSLPVCFLCHLWRCCRHADQLSQVLFSFWPVVDFCNGLHQLQQQLAYSLRNENFLIHGYKNRYLECVWELYWFRYVA